MFPWIGIAPPYQFTENLSGVGDWLLPTIIIVSGTFLNTRFTGRIPLILGWLGGFLIQAGLRSQLQGTPFSAAILPMTGMAFLLFTFYMVTDPATTPSPPLRQLAFGGSVAAVYGLLMLAHVVFGLFFSLLAVCSLRGLWAGHAGRRTQPGGIACRTELAVPDVDRAFGHAGSGGMMSQPIALVGLACVYPDARSPIELWENVLAGRRAFRRLPPERLRAEDYWSGDRGAPDRTYAVEAAVIEGYEFDRVAFRVAGDSLPGGRPGPLAGPRRGLSSHERRRASIRETASLARRPASSSATH